MDKFIAIIILCVFYILRYNAILGVPRICFILGWFVFATSMLNDIIDHLVIRNQIENEVSEHLNR